MKEPEFLQKTRTMSESDRKAFLARVEKALGKEDAQMVAKNQELASELSSKHQRAKQEAEQLLAKFAKKIYKL